MSLPESSLLNEPQIIIDMDWDLLSFLILQEYGAPPDIAIARAITITGSGGESQAVACANYMRQTWPTTGGEVMSVLQKALKSPSLTWSSK